MTAETTGTGTAIPTGEVCYDIPNRILVRIWQKPLALQLYFYFRKYENLPVRYLTIKNFCFKKFHLSNEEKIEDAVVALLSCGAITHVETADRTQEPIGGQFMMER